MNEGQSRANSPSKIKRKNWGRGQRERSESERVVVMVSGLIVKRDRGDETGSEMEQAEAGR